MRGENMATTWHVLDNRLTHDDLPEPLTALMSEPFLPFWWYVENDRPRTTALSDPIIMGTFANCTNLETIDIPETVMEIADYTFWNTKLTSVKIHPNCVYYEHSFPTNCTIRFY